MLGYNPRLLYFAAQSVLALAIESSFIWLPCSFDMELLIFLNTSLLFDNTKYFKFLVYFLSILGISHFSNVPEPWRNSIRYHSGCWMCLFLLGCCFFFGFLLIWYLPSATATILFSQQEIPNNSVPSSRKPKKVESFLALLGCLFPSLQWRGEGLWLP